MGPYLIEKGETKWDKYSYHIKGSLTEREGKGKSLGSARTRKEGATLLIRQWGECIKRRRERWNGLQHLREREGIPMKEKRSDFAPRKLGSSGGREGGLRETFVPLEGRATFYLCIN